VRVGEELRQVLGNADRACAGAAAAVGRRERLVDVEVHDVEAHVSRARATE
jgi:hypothetical protein